jgi:hypothetical protein
VHDWTPQVTDPADVKAQDKAPAGRRTAPRPRRGGTAGSKARGATLRRDLIDVAARTARHGRGEITLHLPEAWHRQAEWMNLFEAACRPPPAQAA